MYPEIDILKELNEFVILVDIPTNMADKIQWNAYISHNFLQVL